MEIQTLDFVKNKLATIWKFCKEKGTTEELVYKLCHQFLGTRYQLLADPIITATTIDGMLQSLAYDDEFTFTLDDFDCVTFVETILAVVLARHCRNIQSFAKVLQMNLISLRYRQGIPTFFNRNYFFTCVDWIPNNQWIITDITKQVSNTPLHAKTYIDKLSWLYNSKLLESYRNVFSLDDMISMLIKLGIIIKGQESVIPYIAIDNLLVNYNNYVPLFPEISIVCIVRPDWDVTDKYANYGTHLNISHLGICLKEQQELYFYHASSINDRTVQKIKLMDYLTKYLDSPTIKGINILKCKF